MSASDRDHTTKGILDRRAFLASLGVGAAGTLAACQQLPVRHALPFLLPPEVVTPGVSVPYASTCTACPAACGLMVTVRDGRPIKLEGHPQHPVSAGGLCALGQAHIRELYHSERYVGPLVDGAEATWVQVDAEVKAGLARLGSKKCAILSPPVTSPTARRALEAFAHARGGVLTEYDARPTAPSAALEAWELVTGRALLPTIDFSRANVVVSLGADFLGTGPEVVAHTAGYAARRRAHASSGPLRHVQVEGALSLTGAAADERTAVSAHDQRNLALHLLKRLSPGAALPANLPPLSDTGLVDRLASLLGGNRRRSVVVSGSDDLGEQVAVALINEKLGNIGTTLSTARPSLVTRGLDRELLALEAALFNGQIGALFIMPGIDPVRQLPHGAQWAEALKALPLAVTLTDHATTTAASCRIVAASHHGLEMWGDAMPQPGVLSVVQPTIRPLLNTQHPIAAMLRWSGTGSGPYLEHLKQSWKTGALATASDFDGAWNAAVSSGLAPSRAAVSGALAAPKPRNAAGLQAALAATAGRAGSELTVELIAEVGTGDGCHSHNAWLRELPDPLTRVAWEPVVRISPATGAQLGVANGDVLKVTVGEGSVTMAARLMPGMHPGVLGVPVGFAAANGYALATVDSGRLRTSGLVAQASATGEHVTLPAIQIHDSSEGRPIVHQLPSYDSHVETVHHGPHHNLWDHDEAPPLQWHMVVDLDACTGCGACVVSCQAENNIPVVGPEEIARHRDMHWLRIDRYFQGTDADPDVVFEPMLCQQCGHAPCETVCPALATSRSTDGLNMQVYSRCVGTRYCANNCPYKMRRFNWFEYDRGEALDRMVLNPDVVVRERGIMEKCTFCVQRIQASRIASEGGPESANVEMACQQSCPARAITFGNSSDPTSSVSRARAGGRAFQVLADLGVEPSVTYLARVRSREGE
ncbi:MAG: 4Fe-4S dicluster domain-containing protein [Planctomycetota bacterium]|nr:4Fe-4S dicluster domain-containing protein [Planctomycetota bacterium]